MFLKRIILFITVSAVCIFVPLFVCYAENAISLSQAYIQNQHLDVYVTGSLKSDSLIVKASNQAAEITDSGLLSDNGVTIRTTVLLDISTSMPAAARVKVKEYIDFIIEQIEENEQYKIVTFGEQLTVLQDFTSDRYDLANAVSKIEWNNKQSMIYDAIYNTIPIVLPIDGEPCYYRTIVITDGIDDTVSGITKEELYLKLQADTYPIDVVMVSKNKQGEPEKELSALTRMSGGRFSNINPEVNVSELVAGLTLENLYWIRAEIPNTLLDGSTRQINITDGNNFLQFDIKVSVLDMPQMTDSEKSNKEIPIPKSEEDSKPVIPSAEEQPQASDSNLSLFGDYTSVVFIGAGVILILLIAIIIAVFVINRKRKKQKLTYVENNKTILANERYYEKTEYIGDDDMSGVQFTIKLSSSNNPSQEWILPINKELLIGRAEYSAIRLDDKSVSREQCKIVIQGGELTAVHISKTNKTLLNGANIIGSSILKSGDNLKFGREVLHIDYIQSIGKLPLCEPEKEKNLNNTESIF